MSRATKESPQSTLVSNFKRRLDRNATASDRRGAVADAPIRVRERMRSEPPIVVVCLLKAVKLGKLLNRATLQPPFLRPPTVPPSLPPSRRRCCRCRRRRRCCRCPHPRCCSARSLVDISGPCITVSILPYSSIARHVYAAHCSPIPRQPP